MNTNFLDDRNLKLIHIVKELIYSDRTDIHTIRMARTGRRIQSPEELSEQEWTVSDGEPVWGGNNEYYWFRFEAVIPDSCQGKTVVLEITTGREGQWDATNPQFLAYVNGKVRQGLDVNHREILLTESAEAGERFRIDLSAFTGTQNFRLHLHVELRVLHRDIEKYYYDLWVPYQVGYLLEREQTEALEISECITESLNLLDLRREYSASFYESLRRAQDYLQQEFYEKKCGKSKEIIYAVGHTHIDIAWLWTLAVTADKSVRSFATALELMRQYPEFIFMSSQPQLYLYVKENAPEVYEEIKSRVKQGRWEAEGGMFVEADCNLASGESLVRQFLYGKRFFREEFGVENEILWLPDVFGYSAALPQIMRKCGIRYFMTTKISWNETNKIPYDTFLWQGIDGTRILTHFICAKDYYHYPVAFEEKKRPEHFTTYNGYLNPSQIKGTWKRYSQKRLNDSALICYGHGDGGGGTTRDMLENQRRIAKGIPGCPRTKVSTALEFFRHLEEETDGKKTLPLWAGELYLEYHRGTYTSMARNKRYNRQAEFLLHNLEALHTIGLLNRKTAYPGQKLEELWKIVLKNQFHDILPGSGIREIYEDSKREYEQVLREGYALEARAMGLLTEAVEAGEGELVVFNRNGFAASDYVYVENPETVPLNLERTWDGKGILYVKDVPALGYRTISDAGESGARGFLQVTTDTVETEDLKVTLNKAGQFTSVYDKKEQRELLSPGQCGNRLVTYEDRPHNYDAWDINDYYTLKAWPLDEEAEISILEQNAMRAVLRVHRKYLDSTIVQDLIFYHEGTRIDVVNHVDWKEKNILLRSLIPVDIHAEQASYEIQYGNVQRSTYYNTSWEQAKFEVCAHKWIDLSEDGYGVSVLNDCKYGYDIHDGVIGLTMLKSAVYPNPDADKEQHEFAYSIVLHRGGWRENETIQKAYLFNNPLTARKKEQAGGTLPGRFSFAEIDRKNVVIEVLKMAEDGDGVILRLYEAFNRRTHAALRLAEPVRKAAECDMLEQEEKILQAEGSVLRLIFEPYEIKTLKIHF
ncbi:MAG: alpha-mannosidase [Lachnospiraceae bacterium]|nr:alpha-mannosidase [Lachnospiraceae bacterium]